MHERDFDMIMNDVRARSAETTSGCLIWLGAKSGPGYPRALRAPIVYVHRLVCWGNAGFPGELRDFPDVHHRCGRHSCVAPEHLSAIGASANALEAVVRRQFLKRIAQLEGAVRALDPDNPLLALSDVYLEQDERGISARPRINSTSVADRVRREKRALERASKKQAYAARRYEDVLRARQLIARGASRGEAARALCMDVSTLAYWEVRLEEFSA